MFVKFISSLHFYETKTVFIVILEINVFIVSKRVYLIVSVFVDFSSLSSNRSLSPYNAILNNKHFITTIFVFTVL
jgi:hypothetical protein